MKQKLFSMFLAVLGLVVGTIVSQAATFYDFEMDLRDANGGILTADEVSAATTTSFGFSVAEGGTITRTTVDDSEALGTITGKTGNNHGLQSFVATVKVSGQVKITMSTCSWGGEVTVKDANNETVATFSTKKGEGGTGCYKGNGKDDENIISVKYLGDATTLTISGGGYVGYFAVEEVQAASADVSYSLGDVVCSGTILPTGGTYAVGDEYTIPANNYTLYKEGYTLTAWTDGTNNYAVGSTITLQSDLALTPVFTENTVSLADRTEPVTLKWNFRRDQGAPTISSQNGTGVWVTQAIIGNETIDVKLDFDTNNGGKLANGNWTDWCQMNGGTTLTIPNYKGATVSIEAYSAPTTTTIDGQTDYTANGNTISYTVANTAETIDIVIGDGSYYRYIQTVLPVSENSATGTSFDNVDGTITWAIGNEVSGTVSDDIKDGISTATVSTGSDLTVATATYFDTTMTHYTPKNSNAGAVEGVLIEYLVKAAKGTTLKIGDISYDAVKVGTDGAYFSWSYAVDGVESTISSVDASTILRNNGANSATAQLNHTASINSDEVSQFSLRFYISNTANNKNICIGNIVINATVNGTVADVETYTLAAESNIAAAGSVSKYPNAEEYDEGTEVTLTATKNFGYNFVNWTNSSGDVVSTESRFKYTVEADDVLTANFEAIDTYELKVNVDGTNDYMVEVTPAATVVDGKWMYETGTTVSLKANEYAGFVTFTNWNDGTTGVEKTITMTEDKTFTANYTEADIIAGWDFYKAGNNSRVADFSSADNASAALTLVKTGTAETSGWLDKSTLSGGGYESFKGAAVNWRTGSANGDVGNWHWQTKINAEAFQYINVYFQMMYNYNAYQKYLAEYSLDGENWTEFGDITMTAAKAAATFSEALPTECNNQSIVYIRMRADKENSEVAGAASANDGNTLAMFFITGTEQLADDGTAPVLVSTIPANDATGASATGKIVLTFDEKIKLQTAGTATLGTKTLTPSVSGKTVTYSYNGLKYNTEYTFTLPANTISDLTDNVYAEPVTITFTTMQLPAVTKKKFDVIVGTEGNEDLQTVLDAYKTYNGVDRKYIFIPDGTYKLRGNDSFTPKSDGTSWTWNEETGTLTEGTVTANTTYNDNAITILNGSNLSIIGQSKENTILYNIPYIAGISYTSTLELRGSESYLQDFTLKNMYAGGRHDKGVAVAFYDRGTHTIAKNINMWSNQDTYVSAATRCYYENSTLAGTVDFICGGGDVWFQECELVINDRAGNVITAPSTSASEQWGFVFYDNTIRLADGATAAQSGNWNLGRPWQNSPASTFLYTKMQTTPSAAAWTNMGSGMVVRFHEYGSVDANGNAVDLSSRSIAACNAAEGSDEPVLTAAQAEQYTIENVLAGSDGWNPTEYTAQVSVENVSLSGNVLSWDNSDYALCWMVFKDGVYYDNVITNSIELTENGSYTVRAANARGGLGESSESVTYAAPLILTTSQNMAGYRTFYDAENSYVADNSTIVYVAQLKRETEVVLSKLSDNVVPANTPVILKTTGLKENGTAEAYYQITLTPSEETDYYIGVNLLDVTTEGQDLSAGAYRLGWDAEDGVAFRLWNPSSASAGIVYLNVSSSLGAKLSIIFDEEEEVDPTAVNAVTEAGETMADGAAYNAAGQRVGKAYKGLVIRNGKKYNNK